MPKHHIHLGPSRGFTVDVQPTPSKGLRVHVSAENQQDGPLAEIITTGWFLGPRGLLDAANRREGFNFDQLGATFTAEVPGEFAPEEANMVAIDLADDVTMVPERDYLKLLGEVGMAATSDAHADKLPHRAEVRDLSHQILLRLGRLPSTRRGSIARPKQGDKD